MRYSRHTLVVAALAAAASMARANSPRKPADLPQNLEPAFTTWSVRCSQCHNPERAYNAKYTEQKQIERLVARMARKTSTITSDDQKQIVAYLTWHNKKK